MDAVLTGIPDESVGELSEAKSKLVTALEGKSAEVLTLQEQTRTLDAAVTHFEARADGAEREAVTAQSAQRSQSELFNAILTRFNAILTLSHREFLMD